MGRLRAAIHAFAALDLPPDELLGHLDHLAIRLADEPHHPFDADPTIRQPLGATCLYAVYDPVSGRLQLARAGHPPPLAVLPDGATRLLDVAAGPPLGLGGVPFEAADLEIEQGTVLALYTDGLLSSCPTEPDAALNRLGRVLAHPLRPIQEACDQAVRALVPHPPNDDAVLLTVRTRTLGGDRVATWTLPADPQVVSTARDLAARQLGVWNLGALAFATELVVSELVTNAIRYGSGTVSLRLILDRALICEVSDGSNTAPHVRQARATDEGGRGLMLVAGLSPRWGVRQSARGKTVWAEIALTPE
jgi:anti-sigma regulatory factor (Ser/Thr protein kinase)